jgi:hypothetical protein
MIKFISSNGDTRKTLVNDRLEVLKHLRAARKALGQTVPHGRNYIGDDAGYHFDRDVWADRAVRLEELIAIIEVEAEAIFNLPGRP